MSPIRNKKLSKHSTTRLKLMLKHRLDKGEKGQMVKQIIHELGTRSKVTPREILNSAIIKHRAMAKTINKKLQTKIKHVNNELNSFIKSANRMKMSVKNLVN